MPNGVVKAYVRLVSPGTSDAPRPRDQAERAELAQHPLVDRVAVQSGSASP